MKGVASRRELRGSGGEEIRVQPPPKLLHARSPDFLSGPDGSLVHCPFVACLLCDERLDLTRNVPVNPWLVRGCSVRLRKCCMCAIHPGLQRAKLCFCIQAELVVVFPPQVAKLLFPTVQGFLDRSDVLLPIRVPTSYLTCSRSRGLPESMERNPSCPIGVNSGSVLHLVRFVQSIIDEKRLGVGGRLYISMQQSETFNAALQSRRRVERNCPDLFAQLSFCSVAVVLLCLCELYLQATAISDELIESQEVRTVRQAVVAAPDAPGILARHLHFCFSACNLRFCSM